MSWRESVLNGSVVGVGGVLLVLSIVDWLLNPNALLIDVAKRVLPIGAAFGVIGFGIWLQRRDRSGRHIGRVALGSVAGGALFGVVTGWIVFVSSLEGSLPEELSSIVLNGIAIGTVGNGLLTSLYFRLRKQTTELARLNEELEDRNALLTQQATQLQEQNEQLDRFASLVSHDLRNPINVASGHLEIARETGEDDHFESIERALARMEDLITDMLALARHGQAIEEFESVRLESVAEAAWSNVKTNGVELQVGADARIEADGNRLQQLFENLFRNAIDHGGDGLSTVRVGSLPGGFYVEDDGVGISAADRDGVWDTGYSTASDGTGYGLAIVRAIVNGHGWRIDVTDGTDGGARFEIRNVTAIADGEAPDVSD